MISALTGLLCALCSLASAPCYLRSRTGSTTARILGPFFFLLALLTKELALSLPLLIALWEAIALRSEHKFTLSKWVSACLPYGMILTFYLLFRYALFGQMPYSPLHANITPVRLLVNAATYTAKSFAPWGLEDLKPFFRARPLLLALVSGSSLILGATALWHRRRALLPGHLFGLVFFGIAVLPVISLYSPWNTYLPSAGIALILGAVFDWTGEKTKFRLKQIALAAFLALAITYSLGHQQHWRTARGLCSELVSAISHLETTGPIYLANLPAEWNEVPLFISEWALQGALRFQGRNQEVIAIASVVKARRAERIETHQIDERRFAMHLAEPDDFFRLESMEILSGKRPLEIGYSYAKADVVIRVTGLSNQGQANTLEIDMGSKGRLARVYVWNRERLMPLVGP